MEARIFAQLTTATARHLPADGSRASTAICGRRRRCATRRCKSSSIRYNPALLHYSAEQFVRTARPTNRSSIIRQTCCSRGTAATRRSRKYTPVNLRLRSGYGWAHDGYHCGPKTAPCLGSPQNPSGIDLGYVLDYFGASRTRVPTIAQKFFGFTLYSNSLPLDRARSLNLNLTFDKQRQWFSLPHYIDTTTSTVSLSKTYTRKLAFLGAYSVTQLGDYFGARQTEIYPPYTPRLVDPYNGLTYPGYSAFRGFSTTRAVDGIGGRHSERILQLCLHGASRARFSGARARTVRHPALASHQRVPVSPRQAHPDGRFAHGLLQFRRVWTVVQRPLRSVSVAPQRRRTLARALLIAAGRSPPRPRRRRKSCRRRRPRRGPASRPGGPSDAGRPRRRSRPFPALPATPLPGASPTPGAGHTVRRVRGFDRQRRADAGAPGTLYRRAAGLAERLRLFHDRRRIQSELRRCAWLISTPAVRPRSFRRRACSRAPRSIRPPGRSSNSR